VPIFILNNLEGTHFSYSYRMWAQPDVLGLFSISVGSWALLVKRGGLGVWHHFLVQRRGGKAVSFLWRNLSISHLEVLMLPTSPNVAKSLSWAHAQLIWVLAGRDSHGVWA
jgi:hypothetical protein